MKWIRDLTCLKKCGMRIQEIKEYLELCLQGESTILKRKEMLAKKPCIKVSVPLWLIRLIMIQWTMHQTGYKGGCIAPFFDLK